MISSNILDTDRYSLSKNKNLFPSAQVPKMHCFRDTYLIGCSFIYRIGNMSGTCGTFYKILQRTITIEDQIRQTSRLHRGNGEEGLHRARFHHHVCRDGQASLQTRTRCEH